ncbi:uncharacterized protein LOC106169939 [Lingula anatina]|uniref:Uncharacterized protein LOC106169939 n=1 Tax=Lingula anatina TaxID=7574 RepID=A0A1S3J5E6_LINAN|nr:uncharacterized protein LOC106169939 [Lingula anatina]|eukprot:XP_013405064.1 uncharacterized protein LOC106169939 [Lingula anatina]
MALLHQCHANVIGFWAIFQLVVALGVVADGYFMKQYYEGISWLYVPYWSVALIVFPFGIGILACVTGKRLAAYVFSVFNLLCFLANVAYLVLLWVQLGRFQTMERQFNDCLQTARARRECICRNSGQPDLSSETGCSDVDLFLLTVYVAFGLELFYVAVTFTGTMLSAAFGTKNCCYRETCCFCLSRKVAYDLENNRADLSSLESITDISVVEMGPDASHEMAEKKGPRARENTLETLFY